MKYVLVAGIVGLLIAGALFLGLFTPKSQQSDQEHGMQTAHTQSSLEKDFSTTRASENGLYQASIDPELDPIEINQIHSWVLHLKRTAGGAFENATVSVHGNMPEHGHGLPTQPQVTEYLGDGGYLVEGMKFHMTGWWVVEFVIESEFGSDKVVFNLML